MTPLESGHLDDTGMDAVPIDTSRAAAIEHFNDCPDCFGDTLCAWLTGLGYTNADLT